VKQFRLLPLILFLVFGFSSCSKEEGEGGNSTIYGTIIVHDYNSSYTQLNGIYNGADEDVYIIYGDDRSYSERIRSNYNGVYEFKYLRPGNYKVYVYSEDSTLTMPSGKYAVVREVRISGNRQTVKADDIVIFK
jgi:hypothetical protein